MNRIGYILGFSFLLLSLLCVCSCGDTTDKEGRGNSSMEKEMAQAITQYYGKKDVKVPVFSAVTTGKNVVGLCLEGLPEKKELDTIRNILREHKVKATFFVDGITAIEEEETIVALQKDGHEIENYGLRSSGDQVQLGIREELEQVIRSRNLLHRITGTTSHFLRMNHHQGTEEDCKIAGAAGYDTLVMPTRFLGANSLQSTNQAMEYVDNTMYGSIVSIKLAEGLQENEVDRPIPLIGSGTAIQASGPSITYRESVYPTLERLLLAGEAKKMQFCTLSQLQKAADETMENDYRMERERNADGLAAIASRVYTTQSIVGVTFRQLGSNEEVQTVLRLLARERQTATFFVSIADVVQKGEVIREIVSQGHELGNAGSGSKTLMNRNEQQICDEIFRCQRLIQDRYGVTTRYFMTPDGKINERIRKAASAMGYQVAGYNKNPTKEDIYPEEMSHYLRNGIQAGDLVSVDMTRLSIHGQSDVQESIEILLERAKDSRNQLVTLSEQQKAKEEPILPSTIKGYHKIKIEDDWRNVGEKEGRVLEKVPTKDKVMFLTFDDWGSDKTIYDILDILKKEKVKGTFFVRGNGPASNPMLLRAIGAAGHDVGNHTFYHRVTTTLAPRVLQEEIIKCHRELIKDLGKCPTLFFRPPTMELNSSAKKAILATGIQYIILGENLSTHDYERTSGEVIAYVEKRLTKGGIVTLHMSDNSCCREVLPKLIQMIRKNGYKIGVLSDYLK